MTALAPAPTVEGDSDYEGEESRYAIYSIRPRERETSIAERIGDRRRIAETSLGGIGVTLSTLREEGEITADTRVGILDRLTREWLICPWAKGDLR